MNPFNIMQQASQAAAAFNPLAAATQSSPSPAGAPSLLNPLGAMQQAAQAASALNPLNVVGDVAQAASSALNPVAAGANPAGGAPSLLNPFGAMHQAAEAASALNPLNALGEAAKAASSLNPLAAGAAGASSLLNPLGALNPLAGGAAASLLNPMNAIEQAMAAGGGALNPVTMVQDMIKQAITAYLSQILPPALANILKNPFSISSYVPLIKKLVDWVGTNPYRILLVVTIGKLLMVVVMAVLAFITFFFTATASAVFIILAGILFVTASTVAMTLAIIQCSSVTAIVWKVLKKGAPAVKNILSKPTKEMSKVISEGKDLPSKNEPASTA